MAYRTHLFNVGAVLVGKAAGELLKDRVRFSVGPVDIDGRLLLGLGSILVSENVPQVRMNSTLKAALDIIGALNLGEWAYDMIMKMVTPTPTAAPQVAQAAPFPVITVAAAPAEIVGRIV
jgi:hypothetical protein